MPRPLATLALALVSGLGAALSLGGVLSPEQLNDLSLQSRPVSQGAELYRLLSYWPWLRDSAGLLLVLVPLALFALPLERSSRARSVLGVYGAGLLVSGLAFSFAFAGLPAQVVGGVGGGIALAAAACARSLRGYLPQAQGSMPLWLVALAFIGGAAWLGAASTPQAPLAAALYRASAILPGFLWGFFSPAPAPSQDEADEADTHKP
jgi:hypothetical protein